ncbi:hypothetical protein BS78_05G095300 [Paspalum vaginatum]|nr:hypothetical protein BS78_05G095300 [Paspalum vaginatum]
MPTSHSTSRPLSSPFPVDLHAWTHQPSSMWGISSETGGMLRAQLHGAARVRGDGEGVGRWTTLGHCPKRINHRPPPRESRKWEDWELPFCTTSFLTVVVLRVRPKLDLSIEAWAHPPEGARAPLAEGAHRHRRPGPSDPHVSGQLDSRLPLIWFQ